MKKILMTILASCVITSAFAQSPSVSKTQDVDVSKTASQAWSTHKANIKAREKALKEKNASEAAQVPAHIQKELSAMINSTNQNCDITCFAVKLSVPTEENKYYYYPEVMAYITKVVTEKSVGSEKVFVVGGQKLMTVVSQTYFNALDKRAKLHPIEKQILSQLSDKDTAPQMAERYLKKYKN